MFQFAVPAARKALFTCAGVAEAWVDLYNAAAPAFLDIGPAEVEKIKSH